MTVALLLMVPALASAQNADHQYRGQGYVFIGEGSLRYSGLHGNTEVGASGEVLLFRGLGVGGELGVMGRPDHGAGIVSVDPSCRFLRKSKVVPFVEGGYSRTFGRNDTIPRTNLFNFGGGINYWAFQRVGLRLEFRDHVHSTSPYPAAGQVNHDWDVRIGLASR